jgi:hypothetical protein
MRLNERLYAYGRAAGGRVSYLSHDLDSMAFIRRQLPVVFLTHTWSSGFAEAKLQAVDAVCMPLGHVSHFTRQDAVVTAMIVVCIDWFGSVVFICDFLSGRKL